MVMSGICASCGSNDFDLIDGFYYCGECGSQSQTRREVDNEDFSFRGPHTTGVTKISLYNPNNTAGDRLLRYIASRPRDPEGREHNVDILPKGCHEFIKRAGLRLTTATELLSVYCNILISSCGVPSCVRDHCIHIFKLYLRQFKIAFCSEEVNASDPYRPIVPKLKKRTEERERKRIKLSDEKKGVDDDIDCNSLVMDGVEQNDEMEIIISKSALNDMLQLPLTTEILLGIIYIACLCSGATWVLMSDVTRWLRENRFPLTFDQICSLRTLSTVMDEERFDRSRPLIVPKHFILPLCEYMRGVNAICQMTGVPVQSIVCNIHDVINRLCYNLNLPNDFTRRVHRLCDFFNPFTTYNTEFLHRFGKFKSQFLLKMFDSPFLDYFNIGYEGQNHDGNRQSYSLVPTIEAKASALILFALKLMFGLDDHHEFIMNRQKNQKKEYFDFRAWSHQLKMRMEVWRGRPVKDVLQASYGFRSYSTINDDYRITKVAKDGNSSQIYAPVYVGKRNIYFKECVPNYVIQPVDERPLSKIFPSDVDIRVKDNDLEAKLTPLCHVATHNRDLFIDELSSTQKSLDQNSEHLSSYRTNLKTFFADFKNSTLHIESDDVNEEFAKNAEATQGPSCHDDSNPWSSQSNESNDSRWRQLFPRSSRYIIYRRPIYCGSLLKAGQSNSSAYIPTLYANAMNSIMIAARPYFSVTFKFLLEMFSLQIGEHQKVIYTFMLMLEFMTFSADWLEEFHRRIDNYEDVILRSETIGLLTKTAYYDMKLHRVREDVPRPMYTYNVMSITKFFEKKEEIKRIKPQFSLSLKNLRKTRRIEATFFKDKVPVKHSCAPLRRNCRRYNWRRGFAMEFDKAFALLIPKYW